MPGFNDGRRNPLVEVLERLGNELKMARVVARMSRPSVAEQLGVSVQTMYNWEVGRFVPSGQHFDQLCAVYGVPPRELLRDVFRGLAQEVDLAPEDIEGLEPRAARGQGQPQVTTRHESRDGIALSKVCL